MHEGQGFCQETNGAVFTAIRRSVFYIAHNRAPLSGQLSANLMFSPCEEINFKKRYPAPYKKSSVTQHSLLSPFLNLVCQGDPLASFFQMGNQPAGVPRHLPVDQSPVYLRDVSLSPLFGKSRSALGCFSEEDDAGHGPIKPVHQAQKHLPWLVILLFDIVFDHVHEGGFAGDVSLNEETPGLEHRKQMVVFEKDLKGFCG